MTASAGKYAKLYLKPGELTVTGIPTEVSTVLGSCVALTFFSPRLKVGAICHAVLPQNSGEGGFKYVDEAFAYMLDRFTRAGIRQNEIVVKLFGGSELLPIAKNGISATVGRRNIDAAKCLLKKAGLTLSTEHCGGGEGRKIHFYTDTGEILLKRVANVGGKPG